MIDRYHVQQLMIDGWETASSFPGRMEAIEDMLIRIKSGGTWRVAYMEWIASPITPALTRSPKE